MLNPPGLSDEPYYSLKTYALDIKYRLVLRQRLTDIY